MKNCSDNQEISEGEEKINFINDDDIDQNNNNHSVSVNNNNSNNNLINNQIEERKIIYHGRNQKFLDRSIVIEKDKIR